MNFETIREHCLEKAGTTEEFPFGDDVFVYKVMGKMYLLMAIERLPQGVNLKCDPELAIELRARYEGVTPGYHMSKKHWNTVELDSDVPPERLAEWIDASYDLVVSGLRKKDREALSSMA